jgi:hypothetical protein
MRKPGGDPRARTLHVRCTQAGRKPDSTKGGENAKKSFIATGKRLIMEI